MEIVGGLRPSASDRSRCRLFPAQLRELGAAYGDPLELRLEPSGERYLCCAWPRSATEAQAGLVPADLSVRLCESADVPRSAGVGGAGTGGADGSPTRLRLLRHPSATGVPPPAAQTVWLRARSGASTLHGESSEELRLRWRGWLCGRLICPHAQLPFGPLLLDVVRVAPASAAAVRCVGRTVINLLPPLAPPRAPARSLAQYHVFAGQAAAFKSLTTLLDASVNFADALKTWGTRPTTANTPP